MKIYTLNTKVTTEDGMLQAIAHAAKRQRVVSASEPLLTALQAREAEYATAIGDEIAIPHARIDAITESAIVIARNHAPIAWGSEKTPVRYAVTLLIAGGAQANETHMAALSAVSSLLLEPTGRQVFLHGTVKEIDALISAKLAETAKISPTTTAAPVERYDFVAVTACPTGVAHTVMAAEALEKFAAAEHLKAKVEQQGAKGFVNYLSAEDIAKADRVILAIGRPIEGIERFDGKPLLQVKVAAPIKDARAVWEAAQNPPIFHAAAGAKTEKALATPTSKKGNGRGQNKVGRVSVMAALLNGLSYMIPIVIVGGIFLAIGLGVGRLAMKADVTTMPGTTWYTIFQIGVAGIQLAVVVLGGFIAQAIGGRLALAPALILGFLAQGIGMGGTNWTFFSYETLGFGVTGSNLSFFGSVTAGIMCGYAALYWSKYVSPRVPKALRTVEPIIIVPLLFVLLGWVLFAFAFYVPLYYLSVGLDKGVKGLVNNNVLWVAGLIGGAMLCFDLGGPVNKIAFGTGVVLIQTHPEVMGAIAAAGSVGPFGMALGWLVGAKVFKIASLRNEPIYRESFIPALIMGFCGISEGAIPYTIRNPKTAIIANVLGGAVAGAISGAFLISDSAAHTGPIVYVLGAIGRNGVTDYVYGLFYIMALIIGVLVTVLTFVGLEWGMTWIKARKAVAQTRKALPLNAPSAVAYANNQFALPGLIANKQLLKINSQLFRVGVVTSVMQKRR